MVNAADPNNLIVEAGNGTLQAALASGWQYIAVVLVEDDPKTARGFSLADNRTAELAEWDLDLLAGQIDAIELEDLKLTANLLLADLRQEKQDPDPPTSVELQPKFSVLIKFADEADQLAMLSEFDKHEIDARPLCFGLA